MQKVEKPSIGKINKLINEIAFIQETILEKGKNRNNNILEVQNIHMLEQFKNVLYFAYENYGYGKHPDLKKKNNFIYDYILVELHILEVTKVLIIILKSNSPFLSSINGNKITDELLQIFCHLQKRLIKSKI